MEEIDDFFWDDLIAFIEEGKVIPIIGSELVTVRDDLDDVQIPLYRHLSDDLAERLKVSVDDLPEGYSLNEVVCRFLDNPRRKKEQVYPRVREALKDAEFPPPPLLMELARIRKFNLFVTVTFDSLLTDAINAVRFGGKPKTEELVYSPNDVQDLSTDKDSLDRPVVYHLLGKLSSSPDYAVCDEDMLEFLHAMQEDARRPKRLFDELRDNHLLILGCGLPNWLARFFIRMTKNQALSLNREQMEVLVDSRSAADPELAMFLEHFSYNTRVVGEGAEAFVTELVRRWLERHPETDDTDDGDGDGPTGPPADARLMAEGAIFLSYASDDLEPASRIRSTLEAAGLDVWFDKGELAAGDDWDRKIRRNVNACSLFVPVVSENTERRTEGYFRREWKWAADRAEGIADEVPFIVPVTVDDTAPYTSMVPDKFKTSNWSELTDGKVSVEFAERLKQLVRDYYRRQKAA